MNKDSIDSLSYRKHIDGDDINNNNHNINLVEPDNSYSRPVKGMNIKIQYSLSYRKHIDGDDFYGREVNEGLTSGKVYK